MTLDDAVAALTGTYPVDEKGEVADTIDITSGGKRTDRDVEPALFASRELAIEAWHREMVATLAVSAPAAIRFTDGPHVDKWNITVMDRRGTHRVSEPRWSVTARVGLIGHREAEMTDEFAKMIGERVEALTERVKRLEGPHGVTGQNIVQVDGSSVHPDKMPSVTGPKAESMSAGAPDTKAA